MKKKKLIAAILLAAFVVAAFAGCASTVPPAPTAGGVDGEVDGEGVGESVAPKAGTWSSFAAGEYTGYYFFNEDGTSGSTASLINGTGVAFEYEIDGDQAVFYMAAVDNAVPATISQPDEDTIVIAWSEGVEETLSFVSELDANEFVFFSNEELCDMARTYYAAQNDGQETSSAEAITNEDGSVTIQLYDNLGDHNSTAAWYTVDRTTAIGIDENSQEPIDLNIVA